MLALLRRRVSARRRELWWVCFCLVVVALRAVEVVLVPLMVMGDHVYAGVFTYVSPPTLAADGDGRDVAAVPYLHAAVPAAGVEASHRRAG